jgi:hypothetical protein
MGYKPNVAILKPDNSFISTSIAKLYQYSKYNYNKIDFQQFSKTRENQLNDCTY